MSHEVTDNTVVVHTPCRWGLTVIRPAGLDGLLRICTMCRDTGRAMIAYERPVQTALEQSNCIRLYFDHLHMVYGDIASTVIIENNLGMEALHITDQINTFPMVIRVHHEHAWRAGVARRAGDPETMFGFAEVWRHRV